MSMQKGTLLLTRSQLASLMSMAEYIDGIENAFRMHGEGQTYGIDMIHGDTPGELEFHIKSGGLKLGDKRYYGLKINASCFSNMPKFGLPNIMGAIILFEAEKGLPLAIVDSIEPTIKRTGAGTAVAAKYLANPDAKTLTICGCGNQGRIQLTALSEVIALEKVFAFDRNQEAAEIYAVKMSETLGLPVEATESLESAAASSDVVISCTPAKQPFVMKQYITPGTLVASIGSDSPDKQELETSLLEGTKVVVDILEQCAMAGELHHGLDSGIITKDKVHAEIGQIIAGKKPGRESSEEIIVYDATGTALQDTAAAALCYEKAVEKGIGNYINLFK